MMTSLVRRLAFILRDSLDHLGNCCREASTSCKAVDGRGALLGRLVFLTLLAGLPLVASAQTTTGSIVGTISDGSQAVVSQATVAATNAGTGVTEKTISGASGQYEFLSLPAATYLITVTRAGFDTSQLSDIVLNVAQTITMNVALKVGRSEETVRVKATPTLVDTSNASLGTVVGEQAIVNMPLNCAR